MIITKCTKCESENLVLINNGSHKGLYCFKCGAWIKWVSKSEYPIYKKHLERSIKNDN